MVVGFTSTFAPKQWVHIITKIMSFVQEVYSVQIYVIKLSMTWSSVFRFLPLMELNAVIYVTSC